MNKKKIFGSITVLAIAAMVAFNVNINSQEKVLSEVSLANIEALADESGGTSAGICYIKVGPFAEEARYGSRSYWCNSETDASTIYPCDSSDDSNDFYNDNTKDRCTK